jgi:hypothetical protein
MSYHLSPVRKAITKSRTWQVLKEERLHSVALKLPEPLRNTVWMFFKRLKIKLSHDPAISLLGIYSKEMK